MLTIINGVEQFSTNIIDAKLYQNKTHHPIKIIKDGVTGARRGSGRTTAGHEDAVPQPSGTARFRITTAHHLYKVVGPIGLLYVCQREMAVTVPHDKNVSIIGSDDVTTCIILVLRHTGSGAVGFAHLDGSCTEECVVNMVHRIQELSMGFPDGRLEMSLIGGFTHVLRYSEQVFYSLMVAVHKHQTEIELVLACVGELNTIMRNNVHWPLLYGAGVMVKSGEVFPANFPDKGPEQPLRLARLFTGLQPVLDVYDCSLGLLRIGPFNYEPMRSVDLWLQQSDEFILQALSTTPDVEPPHTVMAIRASLKYVQDHPFPAVTVFRDNRPLYYRRDEHSGTWTPFRY